MENFIQNILTGVKGWVNTKFARQFFYATSLDEVFSEYDLDERTATLIPSEDYDDNTIIFVCDQEHGNWIYADGLLYGSDYDIVEIAEFINDLNSRLSTLNDKVDYNYNNLGFKITEQGEKISEIENDISFIKQTGFYIECAYDNSTHSITNIIDIESTTDDSIKNFYDKIHTMLVNELITEEQATAMIVFNIPVVIVLVNVSTQSVKYIYGMLMSFRQGNSEDFVIIQQLYINGVNTYLTRTYDFLHLNFTAWTLNQTYEEITVYEVLDELNQELTNADIALLYAYEHQNDPDESDDSDDSNTEPIE